jgi:phage gpG-like protein
MASKWGLKEKQAKVNVFKRTFPIEAGNMAVNHFVKSFKDQGFTDNNRMSWKSRKSKKDGNRAILVKTGALRRSIRRAYTSWARTVIQTTGIIYAQRHNEGLKGMPKRQFMGKSGKLDKDIMDKMKVKMDAIMI